MSLDTYTCKKEECSGKTGGFSFVYDWQSVRNEYSGDHMRVLICILVMVCGSHVTVAMAEDKPIGIIKIAKGDSFIVRKMERTACKIGDSVFQHDVLETGQTGSLGVTLKDNTRLSLGPNSHLTLNEFAFNPRQEEYSFLTEMARGTLMYLSGMMSKLSPESVSVKTPVATVGIRGTRFLIRIDGEETVNLSENMDSGELK